MLPKFSIAVRRFTITFFRAIARAPCARFMLMIAGKSCGVRPTASASANRNESSTGRVEKDVDRENRDHEHERDLHEQIAKAPHAALELRLAAGRSLQPLGNFSEFRLRARQRNERVPAAADDVSSHEQCVPPLRERSVGGACAVRLFRPDNVSPVSAASSTNRSFDSQNQAVAGNHIARTERDYITSDDFLERHAFFYAIAQHRRRDFYKREQFLHGPRGAMFLPKTERTTHQHDREDDDRIRRILQEQRRARRGEQNENDRAFELAQKRDERLRQLASFP